MSERTNSNMFSPDSVESTVTVVEEADSRQPTQVFNDPHVKKIGIVEEMSQPTGDVIKIIGPPVKYTNCVNKIRHAPPILGQHTKEILRDELNYSDDKIKSLLENKEESPTSTVRVLKLRKPKQDKHVKWNEGTVDNENLNRKKSKCCCIYKKPKQKFDESSSDTDDECENCFGHVEVKKNKSSNENTSSASSTNSETVSNSNEEGQGNNSEPAPGCPISPKHDGDYVK